ncbi:MAG: caspase family protein [Methylococcales bacterium]
MIARMIEFLKLINYLLLIIDNYKVRLLFLAFIVALSGCMRLEQIKKASQEGNVDKLGEYTKEGNINHRIAAIRELVVLKNKNGIKYLVLAANSFDPKLKKVAIKALADFYSFPEAKKTLINKANDPDPFIRNYLYDTIFIYLNISDDEKKLLLKKGLTDDDIGNQLSAAKSLRKLHDYSGFSIIYNLLNSKEFILWRETAVQEAVYYNDERMTSKLKSLSRSDNNNRIQKYAADVLKNSKGNINSETTIESINENRKKDILKKNKLHKEKRLALVIGNSNYKSNIKLKNPVNDSRLMAKTLRTLGFYVIEHENTNKMVMATAIRDFGRKLQAYNIALFYYAGHGIQVDGTNYLIPVDAVLDTKRDVKYEAVEVEFIGEELEGYPNNTNIIILDACRNNPFRSWGRGSEPNGFTAMTPPSGTIIAFATSEDAIAFDGEGENGVFTEELVKYMLEPQAIEGVFKKTRVSVEKRTKGKQSPQEWSKLKGEFYFKY